jgi:hypothetical protein
MRARQRSGGIGAVDVQVDVRAAAASGLCRTRGRIALALILLAATPQPSASAQQAQRLAISVASSLQAEPASRVRLPIQIGPPEALQKNSFVRIRGLPPAAALSEGHAISPGSWAVPLIALPTLSVILPAGVQGQSDVAITLMSIDGGQLAEARILLVVAPAPVATPETARPSPPASPSPMPLPPAERERALGLHEKGIEQLERGNVFAARRFFERAAEAGLAQSAVALAATFDPDELAKRTVVGLEPDIGAARKWYERARELGAVEAADRLRHLGAR